MLSTLGIDMPTAILLCLAILLALSFEFVNGFHDTANAVATVIYTHSLKPNQAVVWSGMWNLIGVLTSSGAVAFGIVALLPVELVINVGSGAGFAMVFALLISSIVWNLGTWYLGLPASSSHTLIGSIVGVGLMNSLMSPDSAFGEGVNWSKVEDTIKALIFSPLLGFCAAALLLLAAKALIRNPALYRAPEGNKPPPIWIRALLVFTCTGVSFAHGSNDGQKGMGLIVLILVSIVPTMFARYQRSLKALTNFIPLWVKLAVSLALGLGTMIGWKRIVVTVGEKIGKAHLTYAQGASAELIAFGTIEAADILGLPVSTTHILSSGIAGTMVANGSGIQKDTVRNIILAWVLTLPVCVLLGAALFGAALFFVLRVLGVH